MLLSDFWAQQRFSYLVTYSFQRSPKLTALKEQLQQELEAGRSMRRSGIYQQIESLESHSKTLTNGLGIIDPTATVGGQFVVDSIEVGQLTHALQRASKQEYYTMCPPIYRDALAFYTEVGELVSVLNICFQCRFMQTDQQEQVEADMATYDFLKVVLIRAGHPIENDGWL